MAGIQIHYKLGSGAGLELAIRIIDWVRSLNRMPTHREVMHKFDVSRATAYRWIREISAAKGIF